jgi:hypothetical protein
MTAAQLRKFATVDQVREWALSLADWVDELDTWVADLPGGAVDSDRMMELTQIRSAMRNEIATMRACAREVEMQPAPAKVEAAAE